MKIYLCQEKSLDMSVVQKVQESCYLDKSDVWKTGYTELVTSPVIGAGIVTKLEKDREKEVTRNICRGSWC